MRASNRNRAATDEQIRDDLQNYHQGPGHRFSDIERLRSPEQLARLEIDRVAELAMEGNNIQTVLDIVRP